MKENKICKSKTDKKNFDVISFRVNNFSSLPDEALLSVKEIMLLSGRSRSSIWRDVKSKRLKQPIKLTPKSVRWSVNDIKNYLLGIKI